MYEQDEADEQEDVKRKEAFAKAGSGTGAFAFSFTMTYCSAAASSENETSTQPLAPNLVFEASIVLLPALTFLEPHFTISQHSSKDSHNP